MPLDIEALGNRVQQIRKKRGLSQNNLSEMIDKSPTYLSYIESGIKCMSLDTFIDLTNALNVTADDLLKDSLENISIVTNSGFASVLADCNSYEQRVLYDLVVVAKHVLRSNASFFPRRFIR